MERFSEEVGNMLSAAARHLKSADLVDGNTVVRSSARGVGSGLLNTRWELFRAGPCTRPLIRVEVVRLHEETGSGRLEVRVEYDNGLNPSLWREMVVELTATDVRDGHGAQLGGLAQYAWRQWLGFMWHAPARAAFRMALTEAFRHNQRPTIEIVEERKLPD